jgi:erythromycin esterase-like protein
MPALGLRQSGTTDIVQGLRQHLRPLPGPAASDAVLMAALSDARVILLGEASHGTREFYRERAQITRRLILEQGLQAIAIEGDWPDAWRVNRYVLGRSDEARAETALQGFERFPAWMWRNTEVVSFLTWLRSHNQDLAPRDRVGFYGLDLYGLFRSMRQVLDYLERADPQAAQRARARYACFDHVREDSQAYGYAASLGLARSCEDEVVLQLRELLTRRPDPAVGQSQEDALDELFHAQQNARLVLHAEAYYRAMFQGRVSSWNLRDRHMDQSLAALDAHLTQAQGRAPRLVVWAHNSHLGDARATEMGERGEWNLGQLLRQRLGTEVFSLGMSTHHGWVTAAHEWDAPVHRKQVRPGLSGSWEDVLHQTDTARFWLRFRGNEALSRLTAAPRLQRAIGVIYRPQTERQSHYFLTQLPRQFDALLHLDASQALEPLDKGPAWVSPESPPTYPSGM